MTDTVPDVLIRMACAGYKEARPRCGPVSGVGLPRQHGSDRPREAAAGAPVQPLERGMRSADTTPVLEYPHRETNDASKSRED